jgi:hypothetical protein
MSIGRARALAITLVLLLVAGCTAANNNKPATSTATAPTVPPAVASAASAVAPAVSAIASAAAPAASAAASAVAPMLNAAEAAPCRPGQVKGDTKSKIYHTPDSRDYARTKANVQCFDNAAAAEAAGYRRAQQ